MSLRILMAVADPAVLELAKATSPSLQWCDLVTVMDGREVLHCLEGQKFDGLVLTARMPHADGFEIVERVRHSPLNAGIPIVMLIGENDLTTMRKGFKAGVTFFAAKPPSRERFYGLFNAVRGAMETERRRHIRLPYRTQVTCTLVDQGGSRFVAESMEISEGGMSASPSGGVEAGYFLELEFLLPQVARPQHHGHRKSRGGLFVEPEMPLNLPQKVRARVRYKSPSGDIVGLDFLSLTPAQRQAIQHYIAGEG